MDRLSIKFSIRYVALILSLLATVICAVVYAWINQWSVTLDAILKIIGIGIAFSTALYAAMSLGSIYDAHKETLNHKKKGYSSQLIDKWLHPEMAKLILKSTPLQNRIKKLNAEQGMKELDKEDSSRHALLTVLNFFEQLSVSINNDLADEKMLKEFFRNIIVTYYNANKGMIDARRKFRNNQKLFSQFEHLAKKWE